MKEKSMRSTKMIVFALLNGTGGCFLDPGLGLLVEHPLDQLPKRVGWNWLPQDGNSRTARGDIQRLTVHLGESPSG
jgi:hypothetical protein